VNNVPATWHVTVSLCQSRWILVSNKGNKIIRNVFFGVCVDEPHCK